MKRFNTTGVCISKKHYMVDISHKIEQIEEIIENEFYFVINRPRQYGKTTTLFELYKKLKSNYEVIRMSFEAIMYEFESEERFCKSFLGMMEDYISIEKTGSITTISELASLIKRITKDKEIILIIDEVDRAADNKLFLNFLAMLRSLYLDRDMELCTTFKSVVLAGVHDIKNLKLKFKEGEENAKYNSPWNIAVDFDIGATCC
ncbi:MAG: AAA family ATPase [Sarcina sp.]